MSDNKERDRLAGEYADGGHSLSQDGEYRAYQAGYDAATALERERVKGLVEALKDIQNAYGSPEDEDPVTTTARDAAFIRLASPRRVQRLISEVRAARGLADAIEELLNNDYGASETDRVCRNAISAWKAAQGETK